MRVKLSASSADAIALLIGLWLCSLSLIALVVLPLFGQTAAFIVALALLPVLLLIFWGICGRHMTHAERL